MGYQYLALKVYNKLKLTKELVHRTEIAHETTGQDAIDDLELEEMKIPDLSALKSTDVYQ